MVFIPSLSANARSAKVGKSLLADHFDEALYKKSANGLPHAIQVCQKKINFNVRGKNCKLGL